MKNSTSQSIRLGIFVITGLTLLVLGIYFIGNQQHLFSDTFRVISVFKNVNGLQPGNNVRFAGLNIGTVKQINIVNDTSIAVEMVLNKESIKILNNNSQATINSDGLVGSMVVNILPGNDIITEKVGLKNGDTIKSISQVATADMLTTLNRTNENAALLTSDLLKITNSINRGEGVAGSLIKDEKMATELKSSIENLKVTSATAVNSINKLNSILSEINMDESLAGMLLNDSINAKKLSASITNLDSSAVNLNQITKNIKDFSSEIKNGKGMVNLILTDTAFANSMDASLQNIEEASEKLNENMEALKHNFFFRGYYKKQERQARKELKNVNNPN